MSRVPASPSPMKALREHLVVAVDESAGQRAQLVYAPSKHLQLIPYAFSGARLALYVVLCTVSCGILVIVSVWFPQLFTIMARTRLPESEVGKADYMLILIHEQGMQSQWVEEKVHRPSTTSG